MLDRVRRKLTYANVMASIAAFLALGGGGFAVASHIKVRSSDIQNKAVQSRHLANQGVRGADLSNNAVSGRALRPRTVRPRHLGHQVSRNGVLGAGTTLRGTFHLQDHKYSTTLNEFSGGEISFGLRLRQDPAAHVIQEGEEAPAACPGSAQAPDARPGHLCVFVTDASRIAEEGLFVFDNTDPDPDASPPSANRYGAGLTVRADRDLGSAAYQATGSWAVTAERR